MQQNTLTPENPGGVNSASYQGDGAIDVEEGGKGAHARCDDGMTTEFTAGMETGCQ